MFHTHSARWTFVLGMFAVLSFAATSWAGPFSGFDAGMDGWTAISPFNGSVEWVSSGGQPDGYIRTIDRMGGGGGLNLDAPSFLEGDLRGYTGLRWEQILFDPIDTVAGTRMTLIGQDGTRYRSDAPISPIGQWTTRSAPFTETYWELVPRSGTAQFVDVLANAQLVVGMDVSVGTIPTLEAGIDSVALVPEPAGIVVLILGAFTLRATNKCTLRI